MQAIMHNAVRNFEKYFKDECCLRSDVSCQACSDQAECPYRIVFGQILSTDPEVVRKHQKPPLPFVFKISVSNENTSGVDVGIVIVGDVLCYVSTFHNAFMRLVTSLKTEHVSLEVDVAGKWCLDYHDSRHELDTALQPLIILSSREILLNSPVSDTIRIIFETPARLLSGGSVMHSMDFGVFIRAQMRRCSSLFAYYGGGELEMNYGAMSDSAERVVLVDGNIRYSMPQWSKRTNQAGLLGAAEFSGLTDGMLPLLSLGSYFNAGKGAVYGLGMHRLESV